MAAAEAGKVYCVLVSNTVYWFCAAKFSDQVREGPAGEEYHQVVIRKSPRDGCLYNVKRPGLPDPSGERSGRKREAFQGRPCKNANRASRDLGIPKPTLWRILRKRLWVKVYSLQYLQEVGCGVMDWNVLAKDRLVTGNFLTSCKLVSFSTRTLLHGVSK
jgi:hypothetical protein